MRSRLRTQEKIGGEPHHDAHTKLRSAKEFGRRRGTEGLSRDGPEAQVVQCREPITTTTTTTEQQPQQ